MLCKIFRLFSALLMALVVAGFMLAFIDHSERDFFLAIFIAPVCLIFHGVSTLLDPDRANHSYHPEHS